MRTEYRTDEEKEKLLTTTIDGVYNNLEVRYDYTVRTSVIRYFCSQDFVEFGAKIKTAKYATDADAKRAAAREALRYWDWEIVSIFTPIPSYVRLLRDILNIYSDHARRHDVWIRETDSYVLYTTPPERLLPQEHLTTKPHEPREPELVGQVQDPQARLASLLLRMQDFADAYI
jgi:hypothetical protein